MVESSAALMSGLAMNGHTYVQQDGRINNCRGQFSNRGREHLCVATGLATPLTMNRLLPIAFIIAMAELGSAAPETARSTATPPAPPSTAEAPASTSRPLTNSPVTLAMLEAQPTKAPADPGYWQFALQQTNQAVELIESNTLKTADEFFRVSKFVSASDSRFRTARVRYELCLAAAALGHAEAELKLASAWDELLATLGRPLRTDFTGLVREESEVYEFEAAPGCVQAILREPEKARIAAKSAQRNAEMKKIVDADQADRRNWNKLTPEEMKATGERDDARNLRTREIIKAGELHTASDFANAALVMQHSVRFSGYQTAHELAVCSMLLGDRGTGRWLIAATYDRMLGSIGHDHRFGTHYNVSAGTSTLVRVDPAGICDAERKALGLPTLEEAKNRDLNAEDAEKSAASAPEADKLVAEFKGPNRSVRDPKFGLTATYPAGWEVQGVKRGSDQKTTIHFEITAAPEPAPSLYYRVYHQPRSIASESMPALLREEARNKEAARRENFPDYTNRADSFKLLTIAGNAACCWAADFTALTNDKWAEYFVFIRTDVVDALFFLQAPSDQIEPLRPVVDRLMESLKMPPRQK